MKYQLKVLAVIAPMFIGSIIMEFIPYKWLGDWKCQGTITYKVKEHYSSGKSYWIERHKGCTYSPMSCNDHHDPTIHYGFRRYILILAGIALTGISIMNVINEEEPNEK